jgi:hypothetical protein
VTRPVFTLIQGGLSTDVDGREVLAAQPEATESVQTTRNPDIEAHIKELRARSKPAYVAHVNADGSITWEVQA